MKRPLLYLSLVFCFGIFLPATAIEPNLNGTWQIKEAAVTYRVSHPLKKASGTSRSVRGKARCDSTTCEALIAVQVNTFDSGDSNRDLHMLETVKGALYPVITLRSRFSSRPATPIVADMEIEFAGQKRTVRGVALSVTAQAPGELAVSGKFAISLRDFGISAPSLLGMVVKDEVPIEFSSVWVK